MAIRWNVIASVDETRRQNECAVSGERESTPSPRPIVYISRTQCIQRKLRNTVVALTLSGPGARDRASDITFYALVKVYSKESMLFRKDPQFPEKLNVHKHEEAEESWDVVVSNQLWWELSQQQQRQLQNQTRAGLECFREDTTMPVNHPAIAVDARLITNLGNATLVVLLLPVTVISTQPTPNGAAVAQSLTGSIVSRHGWISYKSPHGMQTFQVAQITSTNSEHQDVALMSETTIVRYVIAPSVRSGTVLVPEAPLQDLIPKKAWIEAVKSVIGGYDGILGQIIDNLYGFIKHAVYGSTDPTKPTSCFQAPFKGILISGRPGTGKSVLASSLAEHSGLPYTIINGPEVFQTDAGASENYLRNAFSSLLSRGKASILILDEVDMIASGRASRKGVEAKLFATLLHLVDSINMEPSGNKVFIIALTNRLHAVDTSLVRSGRLDKVFDLHLKGVEQRLAVLNILSKDLPIDPQQRLEILRKVAKVTHGYVPTDLQSLCTESAVALISRMAEGQKEAVIDFSFFEQALKTIRPSGMGEFQTKIPAVTFKDLFGIEDAIADLKVSIIDPFHNPGKYLDLGIAPPRGIIIHGPPGVGKTMLCCALAEELGINFMLVESSQIRSKVVGESEQNIARMFAQAKANAPCILFIDQIDVLAPSRGSTHTTENSGDRIVTGLLTEMDGFFSGGTGKTVEVDVLVLAATNRPEVIDSAILRPGRLDQVINIPAPDQKTRKAILEGYMAKMPIIITTDEIQALAESTEGYSGADLENLCREAALICLRQDITNTEASHSIASSDKTTVANTPLFC
ncbi:hypothetical protein BGZ50_005599 [Haplosporangium sp. Z 11]|nr:hypothetical protein BGZ50_005599 [Haplosporangium sp. Z 11]